MKNSLLAFGMVVLVHSALADSTVDFRNGSPPLTTPPDRLVRQYVGGPPLVGTNWVAQLYYGIAGTLESALIPVTAAPGRFRSPTTMFAGTWAVGSGSTMRTLVGLNAGDIATLQVRVWDITQFPSYEAAVQGVGAAGKSDPFSYLCPQPGSLPTAYYMSNFVGFALGSSGVSGVLVNDIAVSEGSNGVYNANFTLSLTATSAEPVSVDFTTEDGTALAGQDYIATNGTVIFAPGEQAKIITVLITADVPPEPEEDFILTLTGVTNGFIARRQATCMITEIRIAGVSVDTSVSFNTINGRHYIVEKSTDTVTWNPVTGATDVLGTGGIVTILDRGSGCQTIAFYRARLLE